MTIEQEDIFRKGSRIGVLFIHGLGGTPKEMDSVARRIHRYGFTVSIPVLPGHCGTMEELLASNRGEWQAAVEAAYVKLTEQCDVIFAAGLCAGAMMTVPLAKTFPALRGIILYSVVLNQNGWSVPRLAVPILPYLLRIPLFVKHYRLPEAYPYGVKNENLRKRIVMMLESGDSSGAGHPYTPAYILREMQDIAGVVKKILPEIQTPALVVHASEDEFAAPSNARYVCDHIGGKAELLYLDESYHLITVDQERKTVADATARFCFSLLSDAEKSELAGSALRSIPEARDKLE